MKLFVALITLAYTVLLLYWMFIGFGRSQYQAGEYHYNLVPLTTIRMYVQYADHFNVRNWLVNVVGNVAVFVPFGVWLPFLFRIRFFPLLFLFVVGLFALESLQLLLRRGTFDVDDVLLNTIGIIAGYLLYTAGRKLGLFGHRRHGKHV
ncbi:VanZ family protein [Paenibacillus nasutitermitis]|uniref:VanZ-like domain-containing protein n=1 Tax=Paenibacillus nasutitermitis TaxID=1652958 RepID=A0A916YR85_9BACL|nr:VanZ family protein [Paenibacillus nasutitermitis]GGD55807.1 hypothetical protein GCM10010911_11870 [Paenibacillus nasutitermitis]